VEFYIKRYILNVNKNVKNIKIMHISDLHFHKRKDIKLLKAIANQLKEVNVDMICFTGDLLEKGTVIEDLVLKEVLLEWLTFLGTICPTYIIRGNHDLLDNTKNNTWLYYHTDDFFQQLQYIPNVFFLNNKSVRQENILISGIDLGDDAFEFYVGNFESKEKFMEIVEPKIKDLAKDIDSNLLHLLLIHSPRNLDKEVVKDYDIVLSGHMHNGALPNFLDKILPGNMGILAPGKGYFPKEARGVIQYGKSINYIAPPLVILSKYYDKKLIKTLYRPGISYINVNPPSNF